jgi:biotin carboxylase
VGLEGPVEAALDRAQFPCVIKPVALAGSRGVVRADTVEQFRQAFSRVRALLERRDVKIHRNPDHRSVVVEGYVEGTEFALEGYVRQGDFVPLALFDKPDPLVGPFFEESIYVTPSRLESPAQQRIVHTVAAACRAIGLRHGPVHAEVRVNEAGVYVLEVAARPIGGLCARALRFVSASGSRHSEQTATLEELLLRHAVGESLDDLRREPAASGVMMIPVPRRGQLKGVEGVDDARAVPGVEDVVITAKVGQMLVPLPEGASYPGFIFARGSAPEQVEHALRRSHSLIRWQVERPLDLISDVKN